MKGREKRLDIRTWEIQNHITYTSAKGKGNTVVDFIPVPFIYGSYIHLRDILFLYENKYEDLNMEIKDSIGRNILQWSFILKRYDSKMGAAFFIDMLIKPVFNHTYTISLPKLPTLPDNYDFYFKLHYRTIYLDEWNKQDEDIRNFLEHRVIADNSKFAQGHIKRN